MIKKIMQITVLNLIVTSMLSLSWATENAPNPINLSGPSGYELLTHKTNEHLYQYYSSLVDSKTFEVLRIYSNSNDIQKMKAGKTDTLDFAMVLAPKLPSTENKAADALFNKQKTYLKTNWSQSLQSEARSDKMRKAVEKNNQARETYLKTPSKSSQPDVSASQVVYESERGLCSENIVEQEMNNNNYAILMTSCFLNLNHTPVYANLYQSLQSDSDIERLRQLNKPWILALMDKNRGQ
jgi:hypothetical protein